MRAVLGGAVVLLDGFGCADREGLGNRDGYG